MMRTRFVLPTAGLLGCVCLPLMGQGTAAKPAQTPVAKSVQKPLRKVLFASDRSGKGVLNIYTMNPDGSAQKNLTNFDAMEFDPVWSPDGTKIAFAVVTNQDEMKGDIYLMNADGSGRQQLTSLKGLAFAPTWSPDGKRIAFTSTVPAADVPAKPGPPQYHIYLIDADGKNPKQLVSGIMPCWSPDGKRLLVSAMAFAAHDVTLSISTMDPDGSNAKTIAQGQVMMAKWSPDGKHITYMGDNAGRPGIYVMNADGTGKTQLTKSDAADYSPQWSTDGKRIQFVRVFSGEEPYSAIFAMDADGKNMQSLTTEKTMNVLSGTMFITSPKAKPVSKAVK